MTVNFIGIIILLGVCISMNLKDIRKQKGLSQAELAKKIGVSRSAVSMWEIGASQPDNDLLMKMSRLMNEEYGSFISTTDDLDVDFCLRAVGDSMIGARIYDGDIVFVRKQSSVDNGEIAAVLIDDEATLKRVYYYPDKNKLVLSPENPKYEPFVYIGEELSEVRILGKAVAFQSVIR